MTQANNLTCSISSLHSSFFTSTLSFSLHHFLPLHSKSSLHKRQKRSPRQSAPPPFPLKRTCFPVLSKGKKKNLQCEATQCYFYLRSKLAPLRLFICVQGRKVSQPGAAAAAGAAEQGVDCSCHPFPELRPNKARCLKYSRRKELLFVLSPLQGGKWNQQSLVCSPKRQELPSPTFIHSFFLFCFYQWNTDAR